MRKDEESAEGEHVERSQNSEPMLQSVGSSSLAFRRTIQRTELHKMVPLSGTTIYDMERRG